MQMQGILQEEWQEELQEDLQECLQEELQEKKIAKFLREVARRGTGGVTFASRAGWTIPGLLTLKI
jgi:hypothetical protein